jgi:hypothetical protein
MQVAPRSESGSSPMTPSLAKRAGSAVARRDVTRRHLYAVTWALMISGV